MMARLWVKQWLETIRSAFKMRNPLNAVTPHLIIILIPIHFLCLIFLIVRYPVKRMMVLLGVKFTWFRNAFYLEILQCRWKCTSGFFAFSNVLSRRENKRAEIPNLYRTPFCMYSKENVARSDKYLYIS